VSSITAIDASDVMIDKYKSKIAELGMQHKNTHAVVGNLLSDPPEPASLADDKYYDFDLITVGAALHHFPNAEDAVKRLAERLRPGGVLYIQDMLHNGLQRDSDGQRPRGFTSDELRSVMSSAGLVDFGFEVLPNEVEIEMLNEEIVSIQCFVGRAMKPARE
jgi:SAM-dependent methyltransferase